MQEPNPSLQCNHTDALSSKTPIAKRFQPFTITRIIMLTQMYLPLSLHNHGNMIVHVLVNVPQEAGCDN